MTNSKPNPAYDAIGVLADLFPKCFSLFQGHRRPLKIGIHADVVNTLAGAITAKETSLALAIYCGNHGYLKACCKAGAPRIDLQGGVAGQVTADEVTNARERLMQQRAKYQRRQAALAKDKAKAEAKAKAATRNAGRISLADLRKAAQARRAANSSQSMTGAR
jgi:ProP effector